MSTSTYYTPVHPRGGPFQLPLSHGARVGKLVTIRVTGPDISGCGEGCACLETTSPEEDMIYRFPVWKMPTRYTDGFCSQGSVEIRWFFFMPGSSFEHCRNLVRVGIPQIGVLHIINGRGDCST
ncbi:hypothetical protein AVEN_162819-1 [Araneus ventricosus]|uniref:Uncharacterized protein n=1 Tax=Araneus ventricosus TaxID=182803 RepID=A0A4Y2C815_ARAVE|nr:hypothetical protein AVEN_162819-1 [Araneus ventricosus]